MTGIAEKVQPCRPCAMNTSQLQKIGNCRANIKARGLFWREPPY